MADDHENHHGGGHGHPLIHDHGGDGGHQQHSAHGDMSMHAMAFHFGVTETILFGFWRTESAIGLFLSCIAIVFTCFGLEFVRWYRLQRKRQLYQSARHSSTSSAHLTVSAASNDAQDSKKVRLAVASVDAALHAVQLTLSYLLMLVFMSFNVWLCLAIIVGEVSSRLVLGVLFPHLDLLTTILNSATGDPCCG